MVKTYIEHQNTVQELLNKIREREEINKMMQEDTRSNNNLFQFQIWSSKPIVADSQMMMFENLKLIING